MILTAGPSITQKEIDYVNDAVKTGWNNNWNSYLSKLEESFKEKFNAKHALLTSSCTGAMHMAIRAMGIGEGDEVIVPELTWVATASVVNYVGATPVFVDVDRSTWTMDPDSFRNAITDRTKAVMPVHLYGHPAKMDEIVAIAKEYNLKILEDAAPAIGATFDGKYCGTFGDVATFSFFGNKTITTGEGGMLVTNNKLLIDKASHLKNQGVSSKKEYWHDVIGFNYRMTNICAAIGLAQLEGAEVVLQKKMQIASWYRDFLEGAQVRFQDEQEGSVHSYWMVTVLVKDKNTRIRVRSYLDDHNVETRPIFYPSHKMPVFYSEKSFSVAESISDKGINLPSSPSLTKSDVKYICTLIDKAIKLVEDV